MNNLSDDLKILFDSIGLNQTAAKKMADDVSQDIIRDNKNNRHPSTNYAILLKLYDRKPIMIDGEEFTFPIIKKD